MANATDEANLSSPVKSEGYSSCNELSSTDLDDTFHSVLASDAEDNEINEFCVSAEIEELKGSNSVEEASDAVTEDHKSGEDISTKKRKSEDPIVSLEAAKKAKQNDNLDIFLISGDYFEENEGLQLISLPEVGTENHKKREKSRRKKQKKTDKEMITRPNYFVGIKVSNPQIHHAVRSVQEKILQREPQYQSALISLPTLHLTLFVTHLPDLEHVKKAREALTACAESFKESFQSIPVSLNFKGIGTFGNAVLFAKIEKGEGLQRLQKLAESMETSFKEHGLNLQDRKGFKPHLTIMKLSKDYKMLRRKGIAKIPKNIYADMVDMSFGEQCVNNVQLLAMNKKKDANGYYQCEKEFGFGVASNELDNHADCCKKPVEVPKAPKLDKSKEELKGHKFEIKRKFHTMTQEKLGQLFDKPSGSNSSDETSVYAENTAKFLKSLIMLGAAGITFLSICQRLLPYGR